MHVLEYHCHKKRPGGRGSPLRLGAPIYVQLEGEDGRPAPPSDHDSLVPSTSRRYSQVSMLHIVPLKPKESRDNEGRTNESEKTNHDYFLLLDTLPGKPRSLLQSFHLNEHHFDLCMQQFVVAQIRLWYVRYTSRYQKTGRIKEKKILGSSSRDDDHKET